MKKIIIATILAASFSTPSFAATDGHCDPVEGVTSLFGTIIGGIGGAISGTINEIEDAVTGTEDGDQIASSANEGARSAQHEDCRK